MHGNGYGGIIGTLLANLLASIYTLLYNPGDTISVFSKYDDIIWAAYYRGSFSSVFTAINTIGLGLLVASCLISLMDEVSHGDFSPGALFRHLLKYFLLFFLLDEHNILLISTYLLNITTDVFTTLAALTGSLEDAAGSGLDVSVLAIGINKNLGLTNKTAIFLLSLLPYVVSVLFTVVLNFFAASRLIEIVIRLSLSPLVIGVSGLSSHGRVDAVRYIKNLFALMFQIVVALAICTSLTLVHNSMISNDNLVHDPAGELVEDEVAREVCIDGTWVTIEEAEEGEEEEWVKVETYSAYNTNDGTTTTIWLEKSASGARYTIAVLADEIELQPEEYKYYQILPDYEPLPDIEEDEDITSDEDVIVYGYTGDSILLFVYRLLDPKNYAVGLGLMIAALSLILKSRMISTQLFQ